MMKNINATFFLKRIILIILVSPIVIIWGEFFTQTLFPQNLDAKMDIFASDSVLGFTYKPNAKSFEKGSEYNALYEINSLGLRDREYGAKEDGVIRVLLIGDSFSVSHGLPIEESLSRQIEIELQKAADSDGMTVKFEVINAAAGGYSPYNYWKAYHRWAPIIKPDIVIVGLSPDDYECNNEDVRYLIENGEILGFYREGQDLQERGEISTKKFRKWLSTNSHLYILMRNYFYYNNIVARIKLWKNPGGIENDSQLQLYMKSNQNNVHSAWSKSLSYLLLLKKQTAVDGVVMILMSIPLKMEIDLEQYNLLLKRNGLEKEQIDVHQQLREISAFCKAENIPLLDPRQSLLARNKSVPCYFVLDGHWNAEGVKVAAVSFVKQWRDLRLLPWLQSEGRSGNKKIF
jgi:hypothetical protein